MVTPPEEDMLMVGAEEVDAGRTVDFAEDEVEPIIGMIVAGMIVITAAINGTKFDAVRIDCTRLRISGSLMLLGGNLTTHTHHRHRVRRYHRS